MLGADFGAELEALLGALPAGRQTLLFSATLSPAVERWRAASSAMRCGSISARAQRVRRPSASPSPRADREAAIVNLLRLHEARVAIVFCARREESAAGSPGGSAARGFGSPRSRAR